MAKDRRLHRRERDQREQQRDLSRGAVAWLSLEHNRPQLAGLRSDPMWQLHVRLPNRRQAERVDDLPAGRNPVGRASAGAVHGYEAHAEQGQSLRRGGSLLGPARRTEVGESSRIASGRCGGWPRHARDSDAIGPQVAAPRPASLSAPDGSRDGFLPISGRVLERSAANRGVR